MRACPRSDGCLALDSSSRVSTLHAAAQQRDAPAIATYQIAMCHRHRRLPWQFMPMTVRSADRAGRRSRRTSTSCSPTASRAGWRPSSWAGSARSSSRWCAICRSRSGACSPISISARRRRPRFHEPARLLHPRAQGRARARSIPIPPCWSAPATRSSAPAARSTATELIQVKGFPYTLRGSARRSGRWSSVYRDGRYVTLRLTSSMYHRFHAPHDCRGRAGHLHLRRHLEHQPDHAQARREAVLQERARGPAHAPRATGQLVTLVPVASILVASIRLHFLDVLLHLTYRGPQRDRLRRAVPQGRGDGLVRARLDHHRVRARRASRSADDVAEGDVIQMGQPLLAPALSDSLSRPARRGPSRDGGSAGRRVRAPRVRGGIDSASAAAAEPGGRGTPRGPRCSVRPHDAGARLLARAAHARAGRRACRSSSIAPLTPSLIEVDRPRRRHRRDRQAGRHRLEQHVAEGLGARRKHEAVGAREVRGRDRRRSDSRARRRPGSGAAAPRATGRRRPRPWCPAAAARGNRPGSSRPRRGRRRARSAAAAA